MQCFTAAPGLLRPDRRSGPVCGIPGAAEPQRRPGGMVPMEVYRPGRRDPGADALGKTDQKLHPIVFIPARRRRNSLRRAGDIRDPKMHEYLRRAAPGAARRGFLPKSKTVFFRFSDSPRSGCAHYQYRRIGCPPCQGKPAVRRGFRKHSSALSAADRSGLLRVTVCPDRFLTASPLKAYQPPEETPPSNDKSSGTPSVSTSKLNCLSSRGALSSVSRLFR